MNLKQLFHDMSHDNFENQVVVITGASAGVGRATARAFGRAKAKVALIARGVEGLEGARKEVEQEGGKAFIFPADVSDPDQVENAAEKIERDIGSIDIWVNNAMNSVFSPFQEITPDEFRRVTEVTYLGQVYGTMSALKRMQARDKGAIVLVGSALAYRGIPLQSAYCGAKHAIQGFFDSLRCELLHDNSKVRLSMVQLPAMNTTQFGWVKSRLPNKPRPMGKVFQPDIAAEAVLYAAAHKRRSIFVGFPTFQSIIANKFFPGVLDHYLARTGYEGQQTDTPEDPNRRNNLWEPVPGDQGTYGDFGKEAHDKSFTYWLSTHRAAVLGSVAVAGLALFAGMRSRKLLD